MESITNSPMPTALHHFFDERNFAHVAVRVLGGDVLHSTPMWVDRDGDVPVINTKVGRLVERSLRLDPHLSLSIHSHRNPYSFVQVRGIAEMAEEGADQHIQTLAQRYLGGPYPYTGPQMNRIIIFVRKAKFLHRAPPSFSLEHYRSDPERGREG